MTSTIDITITDLSATMTSTKEITDLSHTKKTEVSIEEKEDQYVITDLQEQFAHASVLRSRIARGSKSRPSLAHASVVHYEELSSNFRTSFRGGSSRRMSTRDIRKSLCDSDWFATGL